MGNNRWTKIVLVCGLFSLGFSLNQSKLISNWKPTKVPPGTNFAGRQTCLECHANKAKALTENSMGKALSHASLAENLIKYPKLTFREGAYQYAITRQGERSFYTVTDGKESLTAEIIYAFGQGKAGQTYVLKLGNGFRESRLSFYDEIKGLDITIGAPPLSAQPKLDEVLGRPMSADESLQCFGCHSTGAVVGKTLQLEKGEPGIGCEGCHGPGGEHVRASQAGEPSKNKIFNPGKLSGDDLSQEFCAACHRGAEDLFVLPQQGGLNNVRFQPYRIFNAKCYSDDRRISCVGCHDVHQPLQTDTAFYDTKCFACHQTQTAQTKICKVGKNNCVTCHMPKMELAGSHSKFTDHRIRIVKKGEPYPY